MFRWGSTGAPLAADTFPYMSRPRYAPLAAALAVLAAAGLSWGLLPAASAQNTAHDRVPAYDADFGQGINLGWYDKWEDADLGRAAMGSADGSVEGVGVNVMRPGLFAWFLEEFGYDVRDGEFRLYARLGIPQHVAIVGYPSDAQRSDERWCASSRSELFKGMWEPIWDGGAGGTPYNEANAYAAYLYRAVEEYGPEVRFWEVWNEPDISDGGNGWKDRRYPGNWFENDIGPCELNIRAPVQAYVRMLRISYEVIKRLRPDDFVAIGGIGSAGFLDAVLRTTDEKARGAVTPAHPHGGGAYFDALSFHVYPHVDGALREWDNAAGAWDYDRHSDRAVEGVREKLDALEAVLADYGFDGSRYPAKVNLCTEVNVPRRAFADPNAAAASPEMQRNFTLKTLARSQQWGLAQLHPYQLADRRRASEAAFEFDLMGMYRFLNDENIGVDDLAITQAGTAYRTYGQLLRGATYAADLTDALALPVGAAGVGFRLRGGEPAYVLWAETTEDGNEYPRVDYALPGHLAAAGLSVLAYDFSATGAAAPAGDRLALGGAPVFLLDASRLGGTSDVDTPAELTPELAAWPNPATEVLYVRLPDAPAKGAWRFTLSDVSGREREVVPAPGPAGAAGTTGAALDVRALAPGAYLLTATRGSERRSAAFVKE